jgi:hypothetical protein
LEKNQLYYIGTFDVSERAREGEREGEREREKRREKVNKRKREKVKIMKILTYWISK